MHTEIKAAFARAFCKILERDPTITIAHVRSIYTLPEANQGTDWQPKSILASTIDTAIEQGLVAAFETADYCPSCLEIVPVLDIVLERCLDCWSLYDERERVMGLQAARGSSGVDPDALARLEKKLENPRG